MLYKRNETEELQLIIAVYVDDVLISDKKEEIHKFKTKFEQTPKITDLGKLKRHLGIWYKWIKNKEGSTIKIHMDDMARKIVKEYEELTHGVVKEWTSPGYPSIKLTKSNSDDEMINEEGYRSMVGKVMYLVNKTHPVCLSPVRELAKHFSHPTKQHWKALTRVIGYIKANIGKGRFLRIPSELRIIAYTDSDYANDAKRKSVTGEVVTLGGSPTYFTSKIQATVNFSSAKAEYIALGSIAQEVLFQRHILKELLEEENTTK